MRKLSHLPLSAVLFFEDEIILRLFPVLRRAWSLSGQQASVGISGQNAKQVLFAAINLRSGHRIVMPFAKMSQSGFQAFLQLLRFSCRKRPIGLLLDGASSHIAPKSQQLARTLNIKLIWLPKQCPELNAMDHLFKEVRSDISSNHQYPTIDEHVACAENYIRQLTNRQALRRAGILSKSFWLKSFFK